MSDRQKLVNTAVSYLGCKESNGTHKKIIDLYNGFKPLARGYKMTYADPWCATFVSAMAILCKLTEIIPTECSCKMMIALFKKLGAWQESDSYVPKKADIIFYDWDDSGKGENTGDPEHVGIVEKVSGSDILVIEGNMNNAVGRRTLKVNGRYIRGYGVPKYKDKGTTTNTSNTGGSNKTNTSNTSDKLSFKAGDVVQFTGSKHYASAGAKSGASCKPGKAKVTAISKGNKYPYHLIAVEGSGSNVYGWVDADDVKAISGGTSAKPEVAKYHSPALIGAYKTTAELNMRTGAGTGKTIILTIPKGKSVQCYGYHNKDGSGTKWLFVTYNGKSGYCSSKYLKKG